jgi:hypothetical protein
VKIDRPNTSRGKRETLRSQNNIQARRRIVNYVHSNTTLADRSAQHEDKNVMVVDVGTISMQDGKKYIWLAKVRKWKRTNG